MNLTHLRYIVEVARHGSVTKAAAALYIGQPNLSKIIKDMESELGITIFRRTSKGVVPTAAGAELVAHAEKAIAEIGQIGKLAGESALRLMLPRDYPAESAARLVKDGTRRTEISVGDETEAVNAVARGECGLAVIRFPAGREPLVKAMLAEKGLSSRLAAEYDAVVLLGADDPLSTGSGLSAEELSDMTEIVRENSCAEHSAKRITVAAGIECLGLISALPDAYMISPPLSESTLARFGLRQIPLRGAEHFIELMIQKNS